MSQDRQELTAEQCAALDPQVQLIEAGPGTGKTKTVVARYRQQAQTAAGVALLSFTNAAVDVARARCTDDAGLVDPPNFMGTFDQFLHRYVVTPSVRRSAHQAPTYLHSWDDLTGDLSTVPLERGGAVRLSRFALGDSSTWDADAPHLAWNERRAWTATNDRVRSRATRVAAARIRSLLGSHVYDAHEARVLALDLIRNDANCVLTRLAHRFHEVIVDEFQDCDEVEYEVLGLFRTAGINVVAVADPDQAIYEFRQSTSGTALYESFRAGLDSGQVVTLSTSFRSSPAICALVSNLRAVGTSDLTSSDDGASGTSGVHIVVGTGVEAGAAALDLVLDGGVSREQTRVLAHRRADARSLTQFGKEPPHKTSNMEKLLAPLAELRTETDARGRLAALRRIERFTVEMFDWTGRETSDRQAQLDHLGITSTQLRMVASRFLTASTSWTSAAECKAGVVSMLKKMEADVSVPLKARAATRLPITQGLWAFWTSRAAPESREPVHQLVRWSHVHAVKGEEYDAVVMALPARDGKQVHVLDDWENGHNSEQRRVLYVGVSRARKVIVLVTPAAGKSQLEGLLRATGIPFSVTEA